MSNLNTRLHPVGTSVVGMILLFVLVLVIRSPSDSPEPTNTAEAVADGDRTEPPAVLNGDSVLPTSRGTAAGTLIEVDGPTLVDGCFRPGSARAEVRAVMGAPDTVDFGAWVYGESSVTFGYGVVVDFRNESGNLKLC